MADLNAIGRQVQDRMGELERLMKPLRNEYEQLKKLAGGLVSDARPAKRSRTPRRASRSRASSAASGTARTSRTARTSKTARTKKTARAKRPRGATPGRRGPGRAGQALGLVSAQPGITTQELAKKMRIHPNYLYRVMPSLEKQRKVRKEGRGYHPTGS
jgi:hypothetical protein